MVSETQEKGCKAPEPTPFVSGIVDLARKTCSCRVFDVDHMPCVHAICAIECMQYNCSEFLGEYYTAAAWLKAYHETIYPTPSRSEWDVPVEISQLVCKPPLVRRPVGRPRVNRLPSLGEFKPIVKKRKLTTYKCSLCGKAGHNKKTCPRREQAITCKLPF